MIFQGYFVRSNERNTRENKDRQETQDKSSYYRDDARKGITIGSQSRAPDSTIYEVPR